MKDCAVASMAARKGKAGGGHVPRVGWTASPSQLCGLARTFPKARWCEEAGSAGQEAGGEFKKHLLTGEKLRGRAAFNVDEMGLFYKDIGKKPYNANGVWVTKMLCPEARRNRSLYFPQEQQFGTC